MALAYLGLLTWTLSHGCWRRKFFLLHGWGERCGQLVGLFGNAEPLNMHSELPMLKEEILNCN